MKARARDVAIAVATVACAPLVLAGCTASRGTRAEPVLASGARSATSPSDLLTEDLDFVIRVDVVRLREDPVLAAVVRDAARKAATALVDDVGRALDGSSAVYVGGRWTSDGFHGDGVIAIESREAEETSLERASSGVARGADETAVGPSSTTSRGADTTSRGSDEKAHQSPRAQTVDGWIESQDASRPDVFRRLSAAPRDVDIFERSVRGRGDAALKVSFPRRGVVLATTAEVDAVLRVLRSGPDRDHLDPPARGVISFAGRATALIASREPTRFVEVAACAEGLRDFFGTVEPGEQMGVELSLEYGREDERTRAATCIRSLIERVSSIAPKLGSLSDSTKLTEVGRSLRVETKIPLAWLAALR